MPKLPTRRDAEVVAGLEEWNEFEDAADWRRSLKGNVWRNWRGATVSVFKRSDEFFGWCIAGEAGKQWSQRAYETEEEALDALGEALGVGG